MDFIDSIADLLHNECYPRLGKRLGFLELMVELASCPHFQNDVDVESIMEATVKFNDVRMV